MAGQRHPSWRVLVAAAVVVSGLLAGCDKAGPPARQMHAVRLLPDTPPPPPPKTEEKKPEPPKQDRPQPQLAQPRPQEAPQPQALRSDEAAGNGPGNGMVAGAVTQDYTDQKIGGATIGGSAGGDASARLAANSFASAATRALNEYLARERDLRRADYRVSVLLWLTPAGGLQRFEIVGGSGDTRTDEALRSALARYPGPGAPPPTQMPQPLQLRVTNRLIG